MLRCIFYLSKNLITRSLSTQPVRANRYISAVHGQLGMDRSDHLGLTMEPVENTEPLSQAAADIASTLAPPERYVIDSHRFEWPLSQTSGVPGLPEGVAVMCRSHASALTPGCGSGKTFAARREAGPILQKKLVIVVTCNRLFTTATVADWATQYGKDNVYCYLDGLGKGEAASAAKKQLREMCERAHGVIFISIESFLALRDILDPKKVGMLLLEETCELASKMLSETCPHTNVPGRERLARDPRAPATRGALPRRIR
jgi:hypothetical protein